MRWFSGNMLQAIAEAHSRRVLLLVFVEGDDMASHNMRTTFEDPEVNKLLDVMGCVPIRLRANSNACRQFTLVYPVTAIPSTFFISSRGNLEASVVGFTDPISFGDRLASLMAACNLKKVDSDMRNVSEASLSVDRMMRLNRQSSAARLNSAAGAAPVVSDGAGAAPPQQQPPPTEGGALAKRSKGERRKKKLKRHEANVQTSIVVLAEQSTQINMDARRSYSGLLQRLATMEEVTSVPDATMHAAAKVHGELVGDLLSLIADTADKKVLSLPLVERCESPRDDPAGGASVGRERGKATVNDKGETASEVEGSIDDQASPKGAKASKGKDEVNATMPPQQPPPPPPPPAAEAVRKIEHSDAPLVADDEIDSLLDDVLDGPALLVKFAVLAQEFAEKVLGSSQCEHSRSKSPDTSVEATKASAVEARRQPEVAQKKQKQVVKSEAVPSRATDGQPKKEKRRQEEPSKRTCQLESLQTNVGDAPEAIAALQDEQADEREQSTKRKTSSPRSQKQPRSSDAQQQQGKRGSEKRKKPRESAAKDQVAGDTKKAAGSKKTAGAAKDQDTGVHGLAEKIKQFESGALASQATKPASAEKKAKKPKGSSNDNRAKSPENGPRTQSQIPHPLPVPSVLEPNFSMVHMRQGIDTITEEETVANDSCLPASPPVPQLQPPSSAAAQAEVKDTAEPLPKSAGKSEPEAKPPTTQVVGPARTPKNARPASPIKSKEFLTASNSQLDEGLVFGAAQHTSDESAAARKVPRGKDRKTAAARGPPYQRLLDSDGDDETVDEEMATRRTPSAAALKTDIDWMDEMARTASRRALLYRGGVEDSLNNIVRTMNDVEGHTMSLSVVADGPNPSRSNIHKVPATTAPPTVTQADGGAPEVATPATSHSKQHVHVTINELKEEDTEKSAMGGEIVTESPKTTHRISVSGTNIRNRARSRPSASRLGQTLSTDPSHASCLRKSASFTPTGRSDKHGDQTSIVLNLPDGSSVLRSFATDSYLDEVRWYTEELLARVLPSCFPFTIARTNPLREFSREDYRKTLQQLHLAPSATLLVLPRSAAQGESGAAALMPSMGGEPFWVVMFRLVFGTFVATPISLIWNLLSPQSDEVAAREAAFVAGSLGGSSTLSALPPATAAAAAVLTAPPPLRSVSSGGLRRRNSSRTENFDIF
ncbi:uncharacterized protein LOC144133392 [Amblyomma americanum]